MDASRRPHEQPLNLPVERLPGGLALVDFSQPGMADSGEAIARIVAELRVLMNGEGPGVPGR